MLMVETTEQGKALANFSLNEDLTTETAANLLGLSR